LTPLFQTPAKYGRFIKIMLGIAPLLLLVMGFVELNGNPADAYGLFGTGAGILLIYWLVMPHRFEIYPARLRVVLGAPFAFNIDLAGITAVEVLSPARAFAISGLKMATDAGTALIVKRRGKLDVSLSPRDRDEFIRVLEATMGQAS
jgi:apolipoprotein N-acyltransferase